MVGFTKESDLRARFIVWSSPSVSSRAAAAVHALSVGVFSKLSPAATLWSDRLGISATYSRGRARGRRDLPCSQRGPAQPHLAAARRQVGGKNSIFHPDEHIPSEKYDGMADLNPFKQGFVEPVESQ